MSYPETSSFSFSLPRVLFCPYSVFEYFSFPLFSWSEGGRIARSFACSLALLLSCSLSVCLLFSLFSFYLSSVCLSLVPSSSLTEGKGGPRQSRFRMLAACYVKQTRAHADNTHTHIHAHTHTHIHTHTHNKHTHTPRTHIHTHKQTHPHTHTHTSTHTHPRRSRFNLVWECCAVTHKWYIYMDIYTYMHKRIHMYT